MWLCQFALWLPALSGCLEEPEASRATCGDPNVEAAPYPDVPLVRQTEHLDIYSHGFVCAGMAAEFDRHASFLAAQFDLELRDHIPMFLSETQPQPCKSVGGGNAAGCVKRGGVIYTTPRAAYHEFGHTVSCQLGSGVGAALTEGFAVMFEPQPYTRMLGHEDTLLELLTDRPPNLSYPNAGHLARWLFEREGAAAFADMYRRAKGIDATLVAIEDIYRASLDDLEVEYFADAPHVWVPFRQCADVPHVERDDDGVWRYSALMDCEAESTMGPYVRERRHAPVPEWDVMYQSFTFTIEQEVSLDYELEGEVFRVLLERCGEQHPRNEDNREFPVAIVDPKNNSGEPGPVLLYPGTWRADVLSYHGPPAPVGVAFWEEF